MFVCQCFFCLGFHILSFPFFSLAAQNIQHLSSFPSNTILFYGAIECGIHFTNCFAKHKKVVETRKMWNRENTLQINIDIKSVSADGKSIQRFSLSLTTICSFMSINKNFSELVCMLYAMLCVPRKQNLLLVHSFLLPIQIEINVCLCAFGMSVGII